METIGLRVVVLGVAESRRAIGSVKSDLSGLERAIRGVSGSAQGFGTTLTQLGNAIAGVGRTLSLFLTAPLVFAGAAMIKAGMDYEDAFAGVAKTTEGVAWGIREVIKWTPGYIQGALEIQALSIQQSIANKEQASTWMTLEEAIDIYISRLSEQELATLMAHKNFGQLTEEGQRLERAIREMSLTIPVAAAELANIGMAAGQAGVPLDQLESFIKVVAMLGTATDIMGEDAAITIARFARILGVAEEDFGEFAAGFGDVLVHLGNITAGSESEIMAVAYRLAALGPIAGLTTEEILGLSAAINEFGIKPERGGTAMRRIFLEMGYAIADGNENLQSFAAQLGMTGDEFIKAFGEDPAGTVAAFVASIAENYEAAKISKEQMQEWGLSGVRVVEFMQILGANIDRVNELMGESNRAKFLGIALDEEATKRWNTMSSQLKILKNNFVELSIEIFKLYYKDLKKLISGIQAVVKMFIAAPPHIKKLAATIGILAAALGPFLVALGFSLQMMGTSISFFTGAIKPLLMLLPIFTSSFFPVIAILGAAYLAFKTDLFGIAYEIKSFIKIIQATGFFQFFDYWAKSFWETIKSGNWALLRDIGIPMLLEELGEMFGVAKGTLLAQRIENYFTLVSDTLSRWYDNITTGLSGFISGLQSVDVTMLSQALGRLILVVLGLGVLVGDFITGQIRDNLPAIGDAIAYFINIVSATVLGDFGTALDNFSKGLGSLADADLLGIAVAIGAWKLFIGPALASGISLVSSALTVLKGAILGLVANPLIAIGLVVTGAAIAAYATNFLGFRDALNDVRNAIEQIDWKEKFDTFKSAVSDLLNTGDWDKIPTLALDSLSSGISALSSGLQEFWTNFASTVDTEKLKEALNNVATGIGTFLLILSAAAGVAVTSLGFILSGIGSNLGTFGTAIGNFVNSVTSLLTGDIPGTLDSFALAIGNLWTALAGVVIDTLIKLVEEFGKLFGLDLSNNPKWIEFKDNLEKAKEIFSKLPKLITDVIKKLLEFALPGAWVAFKDTVEAIANALDRIRGGGPPPTSPKAPVTTQVGEGAITTGPGGTIFVSPPGGGGLVEEAMTEVGGFIKGLLGGAAGGPVFAGNPMWVGEKGRELFWPKSSGFLTSHYDSRRLTKLLTSSVVASRALARLISPSIYVPRSATTYHSVYSPSFYAPPTQQLITANRSMYNDWLYAQQRG